MKSPHDNSLSVTFVIAEHHLLDPNSVGYCLKSTRCATEIMENRQRVIGKSRIFFLSPRFVFVVCFRGAVGKDKISAAATRP